MSCFWHRISEKSVYNSARKMQKAKASAMSDRPVTDKVLADDIRQAAKLLSSRIVSTPMIPAPSPSEVLGCSLHLKLENLQYTSSFKARGATVAMLHLTDTQKRRRVITMSAGNHAQAVAFRARQEGVKATIVMPKQTPFSKVERTRSHSTNIILAGRRLDECEATVRLSGETWSIAPSSL